LTPYLVQVLANAGLTGAVVCVPLLAKSLGASNSEIGILVAAYQGMMLFASLVFGRWADFADRKKFVVWGLALCTITLTLHTFARNLTALFAVRAILGLCAGIFPAALIAYFYEENRRLGRFSGFGSLGWGLGALLVGIFSVRELFLLTGSLMFLTTLIARTGLRSQHARLAQPFFNMKVFRRNWRIYISFLLRHLGAFSIWTIFPLYLAHLGANRFWIGLVYALNPLGQFFFMNILERVRDALLVRAGLLLSIIVFLAFGLANRFEQVIPIQIVLALSWSCLYLGTLKQLLRLNPEKSTATGMLQSVLSLAAVLGALLEGVTGAFGYRTIMFAAAGMAVIGALLYILAREREPV
jgi:predicted MFS family arabinose efflux permease